MVFYMQIDRYLDGNDPLFETLYGFRRGFNTDSPLLGVSKNIIVTCDEDDTTTLVRLDYSKTIDLFIIIYL